MTLKLARSLVALAAISMAIATALGAYASHGLDALLDPERLASLRTGVDYQFFHSLGVIGIALYGERHPAMRLLSAAAYLMLAGIVLFCGGVYASSLGGPSLFAHLAPIGGLSLIVAWLAVATAAFRHVTESKRR